MLNQTIEEIIHEINIERTKSKDSCKTSLQETLNQFTHDSRNHHHTHSGRSTQSSTKESISPDERSCRRSFGKRRNEMSQNDKIYRKKWTPKQQQLLCNLIGRYGSDFTFLQTQFPNKTRKQLKKKYQQIHKNKRYLNKIQKIQQSIIRQRRKSLFDDEIMDMSENEHTREKRPSIPQIPQQQRSIRMDTVYHDMQEQSQSI